MLLGRISPNIKMIIVITTVFIIVTQVSALGMDPNRPAKTITETVANPIFARLLPTKSVVKARSKYSTIHNAFFDPVTSFSTKVFKRSFPTDEYAISVIEKKAEMTNKTIININNDGLKFMTNNKSSD